MTTGYEVHMYSDIARAADALQGINKSLQRLVELAEQELTEPEERPVQDVQTGDL